MRTSLLTGTLPDDTLHGHVLRIRNKAQGGFSFLEVLIALSMLLVGSVAILSLFAIGAQHMVQRKIDARLTQVRPEVQVIVQDAVDFNKSGVAPSKITALDLEQRDFSLDVEFQPSPFGGDRYVALAVISFRGSPVRVLPPIFLTRSTLDPR